MIDQNHQLSQYRHDLLLLDKTRLHIDHIPDTYLYLKYFISYNRSETVESEIQVFARVSNVRRAEGSFQFSVNINF